VRSLGRLDDGVDLTVGDEVEVVAGGSVWREAEPVTGARHTHRQRPTADLAHRPRVYHREDDTELLAPVGGPGGQHRHRDDCLLADLLEKALQFVGALGHVADEPADEVKHGDAQRALPGTVDDANEGDDGDGVQQTQQCQPREVLWNDDQQLRGRLLLAGQVGVGQWPGETAHLQVPHRPTVDEQQEGSDTRLDCGRQGGHERSVPGDAHHDQQSEAESRSQPDQQGIEHEVLPEYRNQPDRAGGGTGTKHDRPRRQQGDHDDQLTGQRQKRRAVGGESAAERAVDRTR
jgi:hypothetical protein